MTELAKKNMCEFEENEKVIKNIDDLKEKPFEKLIIEKFNPYVGKTKKELAKQFNIEIPEKNDKASSVTLAKKMLNVKDKIEDTDEFKKAGIAVKILTINSKSKRSTEGFKLIIPGEQSIGPENLTNQDWEDSSLREYLSSQQFLLIVFEQNTESIIFKGVKFWHINYEDLEGIIKNTWKKTQSILKDGVELEYKSLDKPTPKGKLYEVKNNLPGMKETKALHVRPSAKYGCYYNDPSLSMKLPTRAQWINKPKKAEWIEGKKTADVPENELTDWYMTKHMWWLNPKYMYEQVAEFFEYK